MIKITDLEKFYRTDEVQTIAINKLSFEVKEGEMAAVIFLTVSKLPDLMSEKERTLESTILGLYSKALTLSTSLAFSKTKT